MQMRTILTAGKSPKTKTWDIHTHADDITTYEDAILANQRRSEILGSQTGNAGIYALNVILLAIFFGAKSAYDLEGNFQARIVAFANT